MILFSVKIIYNKLSAKACLLFRLYHVKAKMSILGKIMKELKGNGDPQVIQKLLDAELEKL